MRKLNQAIDRFCALHPRLAIPGLMRYIVGANAVIYLFSLFDRSGMLLYFLCMAPASVLRGELWRVVTYVLIPTSDSFWLIISLFFYYWLGDALERLWGSAKFTIYYLSGTLLSALAALLVYAVDRQPIALFGASYVNTALFMAYALTYPETIVQVMFILPVKMKWLAWLEAVLYGVQIIQYAAAGMWGMSLVPVVALLNLFVFFSPDFSRRVDRFQARHRSEAVQFRKAVKEQKRQKGYNHKCEVCGRTDTDFPDLQFRYCSKCTGYHCFCEEHIFNHTHHIE